MDRFWLASPEGRQDRQIKRIAVERDEFSVRVLIRLTMAVWVNRDWAGQAAGPAMSAVPR
jgi:hypothetical protein